MGVNAPPPPSEEQGIIQHLIPLPVRLVRNLYLDLKMSNSIGGGVGQRGSINCIILYSRLPS